MGVRTVPGLREAAGMGHQVSVIAWHDVLRDELVPVPDPDATLKESDTPLMPGRDADLARLGTIT